MPIYEYVCRNCGHELEQLQRLSDDPLTDCPACAEAQLKRKISAAGFRLSGGGWYETDFKSDGKRNLAGNDDKSSGASTADAGNNGGEAKTDKSSASEKSSSKTDKTKDSKPAKTESKKPATGSSD